MRVLFLENQDSFSWNLIDRLPCNRNEVTIRPGFEVARDAKALTGFDCVVIGPGPTDPVRAGLVGVVDTVVQQGLPLLGICLGHQTLGLAFGAILDRVRPAHGRQSDITFHASRLLPGMLGQERVMRYHSLALTRILAPLKTIARTEDGIVMAIEHETLPLLGLQFHPDSYATPRGAEMIASFFQAVS